MNKIETLQNCTVEGNVVKLPDGQLDRKVYVEVKNAIDGIGGKWKGGKIAGFVFNSNPTDLLAEIADGVKRNLKKEFQFFATPEKLADRMVEMSELDENSYVCEPQAGQAAIINAIHEKFPEMIVNAYELMPENQMFLVDKWNINFIAPDFLLDNDGETYSHIIANPPFAKNQDIDHVHEMYKHLEKGGRLVTITSSHWVNSTNKKETEFKEWLKNRGAKIEVLEQGTFKESGTNVGAMLLTINKPIEKHLF